MGFFRKLFSRGSKESASEAPDAAVATDDIPPAATAADHGIAADDQTPPAASQRELAPPGPPAPGSPPTTAPLDPEHLPPAAAHGAPKPPAPGGTNILGGTHELVSAPMVAAIASTSGLAAWASRDLGRVRRNNQDSVFSMILTLPQGEHDSHAGLFVVADGMGGHSGGEIASRRAIETVMVQVLEQLALPSMADEEPGSSLPLLMIGAVQEANARIWQEAQEHGTDMGTTCTAVLLFHDSLYIAHVGDSRAYLSAGGGLRQITTDHSTVGRLIAMGQITEEEARTHPNRNQLYRTVGQHPDVQVDSIYQPTEGVTHLLLCSDGLWSMIDDDEIAAILAETPWPQDACQRLIARANLAGGDDNISAVVVSLPTVKQQEGNA